MDKVIESLLVLHEYAKLKLLDLTVSGVSYKELNTSRCLDNYGKFIIGNKITLKSDGLKGVISNG